MSRFTGFEQSAPFPIARIEPLESDSTSSVETDALGAKVIELYSTLKSAGRQLPEKVDKYLAHLSDMEMLADLMAATFVNDPFRRQQLLEELSLNRRLRLVIQYLARRNRQRRGLTELRNFTVVAATMFGVSRVPRVNSGPSFRRCNRTPFGAGPRFRSA